MKACVRFVVVARSWQPKYIQTQFLRGLNNPCHANRGIFVSSAMEGAEGIRNTSRTAPRFPLKIKGQACSTEMEARPQVMQVGQKNLWRQVLRPAKGGVRLHGI
jgi:hypothetical protein